MSHVLELSRGGGDTLKFLQQLLRINKYHNNNCGKWEIHTNRKLLNTHKNI